MLGSLAVALLALRAGLELRRLRQRGQERGADLVVRHMKLAKPGVVLVCLGFVGGPISAMWLRDWRIFSTLHAFLALLSLGLFIAAGLLGVKLSQGRSRAVDAHGWLGLLAALAALVATVAGFVLLP